MRLDVPTLIACNIATRWALTSVVAVVMWRRLPPGGALYLGALVLQGLAAELALLGGVHDAWPSDLASNLLLSVGFSLSYLGLAQMVDARPFWLAVIAPPLLVAAVCLSPLASASDTAGVCNLLGVLPHLATMSVLFQRLRQRPDRPTALLATTETGIALLLGACALATKLQPLSKEPVDPRWYSSDLLAAQVLLSLHVVAVLLMVQSRALDRAEELVARDALTGVASRSCLFSLVPVLLARAHATSRSCALLMVDLDWFKRVNDDYGHQVGDEVLVAVAHAMQRSLRPSDVIGRYGGEEFCVLLYGAVAVQAIEVAERIRASIRVIPRPAHAPLLNLTVSIGIAEADPRATVEFEELLRRADAAMYRVKLAGRDGVAIDGISAVAHARAESSQAVAAA